MPPSLVWIAQSGNEDQQEGAKRNEIVRSHVMKIFQADRYRSKVQTANKVHRNKDREPKQQLQRYDFRSSYQDPSREEEWRPSFMSIISLSGAYFDPFDSLPAQTGDALSNKLLHFCK